MNSAGIQLQDVLKGKEKLLFDGAMGTMLQTQGFEPGHLADLLCLDEPERISAIHRAYVEAGAQALTTNSFNANRDNLAKAGSTAQVSEIYAAAVACARAADPAFVAADIGSTGQMLEPFGDLEPDDAYDLFAEQSRAAQDAGADLILIETIPDVIEVRIAIQAAKENSDLPVFASMTFEESGHTLVGDGIEAATQAMEEAGADVVGINCSHGPEVLRRQIAVMCAVATRPVLVQPNAGMPVLAGGVVSYPYDPCDFANAVRDMLASGVTIFGSCCGSTPAFTAELAKLL